MLNSVQSWLISTYFQSLLTKHYALRPNANSHGAHCAAELHKPCSTLGKLYFYILVWHAYVWQDVDMNTQLTYPGYNKWLFKGWQSNTEVTHGLPGAGGIFNMVWNPHSSLAGCSAGNYALIFAHFAELGRSCNKLPWRTFHGLVLREPDEQGG